VGTARSVFTLEERGNGIAWRDRWVEPRQDAAAMRAQGRATGPAVAAQRAREQQRLRVAGSRCCGQSGQGTTTPRPNQYGLGRPTRGGVRARGAARPGNAEYNDVVTAHTQGKPAEDMLRTDFKATQKRLNIPSKVQPLIPVLSRHYQILNDTFIKGNEQL
jgi:hypothetical protein